MYSLKPRWMDLPRFNIKHGVMGNYLHIFFVTFLWVIWTIIRFRLRILVFFAILDHSLRTPLVYIGQPLLLYFQMLFSPFYSTILKPNFNLNQIKRYNVIFFLKNIKFYYNIPITYTPLHINIKIIVIGVRYYDPTSRCVKFIYAKFSSKCNPTTLYAGFILSHF